MRLERRTWLNATLGPEELHHAIHFILRTQPRSHRRRVAIMDYADFYSWVADRSSKTALIDSHVYPAPFIAGLFGYSCNGGMQGNCSQVLYLLGIVVTEIILTGGAVLGNVLVRKS